MQAGDHSLVFARLWDPSLCFSGMVLAVDSMFDNVGDDLKQVLVYSSCYTSGSRGFGRVLRINESPYLKLS